MSTLHHLVAKILRVRLNTRYLQIGLDASCEHPDSTGLNWVSKKRPVVKRGWCGVKLNLLFQVRLSSRIRVRWLIQSTKTMQPISSELTNDTKYHTVMCAWRRCCKRCIWLDLRLCRVAQGSVWTPTQRTSCEDSLSIGGRMCRAGWTRSMDSSTEWTLRAYMQYNDNKSNINTHKTATN